MGYGCDDRHLTTLSAPGRAVRTNPLMRLLITVLASAFLLLPAGAGAQETNAPPGNAGIGEYVESVPAAGGNRTVDPNRGGNDGISAETRGELEAAGTDGKLAADLASGGTPRDGRATGGSSGSGSGSSSGGGVSTLPDESAESPVSAVVEAVTGGSASDSGLGPMLPILLLLALGGMVAVAVARRRTTG